MGAAKDIADKWFQSFEQRDPASAEKYYDRTNFEAAYPGVTYRKGEQLTSYLRIFTDALTDIRHDIKHVIDAGDTVVLEGIGGGTHSGTLQTPNGPVAATGKRIALPFIAVLVAKNGKITRLNFSFDQVTFLMQLGLMSKPEPAPAPA